MKWIEVTGGVILGALAMALMDGEFTTWRDFKEGSFMVFKLLVFGIIAAVLSEAATWRAGIVAGLAGEAVVSSLRQRLTTYQQFFGEKNGEKNNG